MPAIRNRIQIRRVGGKTAARRDATDADDPEGGHATIKLLELSGVEFHGCGDSGAAKVVVCSGGSNSSSKHLSSCPMESTDDKGEGNTWSCMWPVDGSSLVMPFPPGYDKSQKSTISLRLGIQLPGKNVQPLGIAAVSIPAEPKRLEVFYPLVAVVDCSIPVEPLQKQKRFRSIRSSKNLQYSVTQSTMLKLELQVAWNSSSPKHVCKTSTMADGTVIIESRPAMYGKDDDVTKAVEVNAATTASATLDASVMELKESKTEDSLRDYWKRCAEENKGLLGSGAPATSRIANATWGEKLGEDDGSDLSAAPGNAPDNDEKNQGSVMMKSERVNCLLCGCCLMEGIHEESETATASQVGSSAAPCSGFTTESALSVHRGSLAKQPEPVPVKAMKTDLADIFYSSGGDDGDLELPCQEQADENDAETGQLRDQVDDNKQSSSNLSTNDEYQIAAGSQNDLAAVASSDLTHKSVESVSTEDIKTNLADIVYSSCEDNLESSCQHKVLHQVGMSFDEENHVETDTGNDQQPREQDNVNQSSKSENSVESDVGALISIGDTYPSTSPSDTKSVTDSNQGLVMMTSEVTNNAEPKGDAFRSSVSSEESAKPTQLNSSTPSSNESDAAAEGSTVKAANISDESDSIETVSVATEACSEEMIYPSLDPSCQEEAVVIKHVEVSADEGLLQLQEELLQLKEEHCKESHLEVEIGPDDEPPLRSPALLPTPDHEPILAVNELNKALNSDTSGNHTVDSFEATPTKETKLHRQEPQGELERIMKNLREVFEETVEACQDIFSGRALFADVFGDALDDVTCRTDCTSDVETNDESTVSLSSCESMQQSDTAVDGSVDFVDNVSSPKDAEMPPERSVKFERGEKKFVMKPIIITPSQSFSVYSV